MDTSGAGGGTIGQNGGSFFATNMTLRNLLMYAYASPNGVTLDAQIIGGPGWARTDHFDIEAKPEGGARVLPGEQTKAMVQSLLEDRFQLKVHRETRDLPVYNLVLTKKGPKLSEDQAPPNPRQAFITFAWQGDQLGPLPRGALRMVTGSDTTTIIGTAIPLARIVAMLQGKSDRIIIDKTGLDGLIDVNLEFRQDLAAAPPDAGAPGAVESATLFTALQEIGLKLESAKAPLEVLVIDSVQRPSEN